MKKIYFFFMLMVMSVSGAFAQTEVEHPSDIKNSKAYTIESGRCFLQVIEGGTTLYTSTGTATGVADTQNAADAKQQFALINGGKNFFLYSVGAGKFIDNQGNLTDDVTEDVVINVVDITATSPSYPINLNWGDSKYLNTQIADQTATGYIIDDWNDLDVGNEFLLIEAADFSNEAAIAKAVAYDSNILVDTIKYVYMYNGEEVYSYTQVVKGKSPLTVTYDAPGTRVGIACSDATPASKEITANTVETVTYNFTVDYSVLPFVPTTVEDGKFAADTKWYYISPVEKTAFAYTTEDDDYTYSVENNGVRVTDPHYLFAFTGDPFAGYQIYNYAKGATKNLYGVENVGAYYSEAAFTEGKACKFFLEAGTDEGQFRFNKTTNSNCYIYTYQGYVQLFTWSSASTYSDCQYYISAATDAEVELAQIGVLSADASYANNTVFRNGEAIESLQILFEGTEADAAIAIVAGMETGKITLQDADGNVVATPTYALNAEDPTILDIKFDPAFNTEGDYVFVVERGVVKGSASGMPNNEIKLKYSFQNVAEQIVTARIWKTMSAYDSYGYTNWSTLPYTTHEDGEYYTCKVKILGTDSFVLMDWTGENVGDTLAVQFDLSKSYYNVTSIAGNTGDSWIGTNFRLDAYGYDGAYFYPSYSDASFDGSYGYCALSCFDYYDCYTLGNSGYNTYVLADFYMDNRYGYTDIIESTVHGSAFQELWYDDASYPAFPNLPYVNGTYSIKTGIANDSTIVLQGYRGVEGEDLTIVFDPTTGDVVSFNGLDVDEYGSSEIASGIYAYVGSYSPIKYDPETKSGYAIISLYTNDYYYIYVSIGDYTPTTDIKAVAGETDGKAVIYNLAGQKMTSPRKGVNIINGKKVMVK